LEAAKATSCALLAAEKACRVGGQIVTTLSSTIPNDAKEFIGLMDYGIDTNGNYVFFGFNLKSQKRIVLQGNFKMLGVTINYLQTIANEAQRRRQSLDPNSPDLEARRSQSNPAQQATLEPDISGTSVAFLCTKLDGTQIEAQLSFDMAKKLLANLPETIAEMERRQAAHAKQH
jgi:hypothetical protein